MEQARFGDRTRFESRIEESDFLLPSLVLQPLVENAVGIDNVRFRLEQMLGGSIAIESTPGQGTTVTITIPRSPSGVR